jgi:hypothetical protein
LQPSSLRPLSPSSREVELRRAGNNASTIPTRILIVKEPSGREGANLLCKILFTDREGGSGPHWERLAACSGFPLSAPGFRFSARAFFRIARIRSDSVNAKATFACPEPALEATLTRTNAVAGRSLAL